MVTSDQDSFSIVTDLWIPQIQRLFEDATFLDLPQPLLTLRRADDLEEYYWWEIDEEGQVSDALKHLIAEKAILALSPGSFRSCHLDNVDASPKKQFVFTGKLLGHKKRSLLNEASGFFEGLQRKPNDRALELGTTWVATKASWRMTIYRIVAKAISEYAQECDELIARKYARDIANIDLYLFGDDAQWVLDKDVFDYILERYDDNRPVRNILYKEAQEKILEQRWIIVAGAIAIAVLCWRDPEIQAWLRSLWP